MSLNLNTCAEGQRHYRFVHSFPIIDTVLFLAVVTLPLYLWDSGLPQISHIFLALAILIQVILFRGTTKFPVAAKILFTLFIFSFSLDCFRFFWGGINEKYLLTSLYTLFSAFTFIAFSSFVLRRPRAVVTALLLAIFVAVLGVLLNGVNLTSVAGSEVSYRAAGTFNNPNQLGYFGVCALSSIFLFFWTNNIKPLITILAAAACLFLIISSLSKAASVSAIVCIFLFIVDLANQLFSNKFFGSRRFWVIAFVALLFVSLACLLGLNPINIDLEQFKIYDRLSSIGVHGDDSLDGRGYNLLYTFGAFELLMGYGPSVVNNLIGHELHSTFGSYFVNYGILGGSLYLLFFFYSYQQCARSLGVIRSAICFSPVVLYGITHNGSRFSIVYLFIVCSVSVVGSRYAVSMDQVVSFLRPKR